MAFLHSVNVDGEQGLLRIKKKLDKSIKKKKIYIQMNILQQNILNTKSTFFDYNLQCFMYVCLIFKYFLLQIKVFND